MEITSEKLIEKIVENNEKEIIYLSKKMNNYLKLFNSGVLSDESALIIKQIIDQFMSVIFYYQKNTLEIMNLIKSGNKKIIPQNIYYQKSVNLINHFHILAQNNELTKLTNFIIKKKIDYLINRENQKNRINNTPYIKNLWKKMNSYNDTNNLIQKLLDYKQYLQKDYQNKSESRSKTRINQINKRVRNLKRKKGKIISSVNSKISHNKQTILKKIMIKD